MRILIVLFFIPRFLFSQNSAVYDLRQNANYDSIIMNKDNIHVKDYPTDNLNYVKTLLYTWKLMKLDSILFFTGNNGVLLQSLSSV